MHHCLAFCPCPSISQCLVVALPCSLLWSSYHYPLEALLWSQRPSPHPLLRKLSGLTLAQKMKATSWNLSKLPFNLSRLLWSPSIGKSPFPSNRSSDSPPAHEAVTLYMLSRVILSTMFPHLNATYIFLDISFSTPFLHALWRLWMRKRLEQGAMHKGPP